MEPVERLTFCLRAMIKKLLFSFALGLAFSQGALCEDLGAQNNTYPVGKSAADQIKDVFREKERTGELVRFWNQYRDKTIDAVKHPAPLGIASNYEVSTKLYDPRFVIPQDYRDEKGQVVVRRGTVIEPLKIMPLTMGLIFIDGRDQKQVDYAIAAGRREPLKIVLTAGSYYDLRVKYQNQDWNGTKTIPFYFDQNKMIINQLARLYQIKIDAVPAKLTQVGNRLQIQSGLVR